MKRKSIQRLTLASLFLALGFVLPYLALFDPQIGNVFLPMHLPVLLCGMICGWQYGAVVGAAVPLLRSLLIQAPPIVKALGMAPELLTYGLVAGLLFALWKRKRLLGVYASLLIAMVAGRVVWGLFQILICGVQQESFTFSIFLTTAFVTAIPGIILQIVLIPAILIILDRTGLVPFDK